MHAHSRKLEIIFDIGCDSVLVLFVQVGDLRLALQRAEQTAARKEDYLRHEISELHARVRPLPCPALGLGMQSSGEIGI